MTGLHGGGSAERQRERCDDRNKWRRMRKIKWDFRTWMRMRTNVIRNALSTSEFTWKWSVEQVAEKIPLLLWKWVYCLGIQNDVFIRNVFQFILIAAARRFQHIKYKHESQQTHTHTLISLSLFIFNLLFRHEVRTYTRALTFTVQQQQQPQ